MPLTCNRKRERPCNYDEGYCRWVAPKKRKKYCRYRYNSRPVIGPDLYVRIGKNKFRKVHLTTKLTLYYTRSIVKGKKKIVIGRKRVKVIKGRQLYKKSQFKGYTPFKKYSGMGQFQRPAWKRSIKK